MNAIEQLLGRVLGAGVKISTAALVIGLIIAVIPGGSALGARVLGLGVVILIGTPVARVAVSTFAYAHRRDWTFTVLTLIVLGELIASIVAAVRGR